MSDRVAETYESLWGGLMFVMHDIDYLWQVNKGRADWVESLGLGAGLRVLDLGCGNGILDIALARRGHTVIGVDRVASVIDAARRAVTSEPVEFIASDLRDVDFPAGRFDLVMMFGLVGLMSITDDRSLLRRSRRWLSDEGRLLVDGDLELAEEESSQSEHPDGVIHWHWTSDPVTRTNHLQPELHRPDGTIIELRDPIDPARGDHPGLVRYIYQPGDLIQLVEETGFTVRQIGHFLEHVFPDQEPDRFTLLGEPA